MRDDGYKPSDDTQNEIEVDLAGQRQRIFLGSMSRKDRLNLLFHIDSLKQMRDMAREHEGRQIEWAHAARGKSAELQRELDQQRKRADTLEAELRGARMVLAKVKQQLADETERAEWFEVEHAEEEAESDMLRDRARNLAKQLEDARRGCKRLREENDQLRKRENMRTVLGFARMRPWTVEQINAAAGQAPLPVLGLNPKPKPKNPKRKKAKLEWPFGFTITNRLWADWKMHVGGGMDMHISHPEGSLTEVKVTLTCRHPLGSTTRATIAATDGKPLRAKDVERCVRKVINRAKQHYVLGPLHQKDFDGFTTRAIDGLRDAWRDHVRNYKQTTPSA